MTNRIRQNIVEVRRVIFVEPHEVLVVIDKRSGRLVFHGGVNSIASGQATAFFLPPYCELLTMMWGRALRRKTSRVTS